MVNGKVSCKVDKNAAKRKFASPFARNVGVKRARARDPTQSISIAVVLLSV
jgi:hypothetical protein